MRGCLLSVEGEAGSSIEDFRINSVEDGGALEE